MEEEIQLSQEDVFNVIEFAENLYGFGKSSLFRQFGSNYYNYDLMNKELIDLNNNSQVPTYSKIEEALVNYKNSAEILQDYSNFMYYWDTIYQSTIDYLKGLLSFDLSMHCINANNPSQDYKSQEYKDDIKRVYKFFNKFNYKQEFNKVLDNMLKQDTCFVWMRDSQGSYDNEILEIDNEDSYEVKRTQNFALQLMPQKYCKITGTFKDGFLWDFDLNYFNQSTVNINNYDPSLRKALTEKVKNKEIKSFILNNKELNETNGYGDNGWTRTQVDNGAWCFKTITSTYVTVPPKATLMKNVFDNDTIQKLQKDKDIASAYALLVGEMKTMKDQVTKQKDPFTINPKTLGSLLKLIQSGLKRNVKPIALPLEETKFMQFNDNSPRMAINQYRTSSANGVSASGLIFNDDKMGQFELQSAIMTDYNFVKPVYLQFQNFLNFFVNKKTKKYKFSFTLDGCTQPFEREHRINNLFRLLDKGLTPNLSKIASTFGYGMQEFQASLEEAHYGGLTDVTTMLQNANTTKFGEDVNGRPTKADNDLTQSGENSRDYG